MRDVFQLLPLVLAELQQNGLKRGEAEQLCLVELGFLLAETVDRDIAVSDAWTLFSGYPFAKARGLVDADGEALLRATRYALWNFGRSRAWEDALDQYEEFPSGLKAYAWADRSDVVQRQTLTAASNRWGEYGAALLLAPPFAGGPCTFATKGSYRFFAGRSPITVQLPDVPVHPIPAHDLDRPLAGGGGPIEIRWDALVAAAEEMDQRVPRDRAGVLKTARLIVELGEEDEPAESFTIDRVAHLLGIVGAGKSTLRDVLTYYLVKHVKMRVTIVVGDVVEVLKLVELFESLDCGVAPIIGASNREQHAQRLHRRLAGRGKPSLLTHDDDAFDYLSTACAVSGLLDDDDAPLTYADAPCTRLHPKRKRKPRDRELPPHTRDRHVCPFWSRCPRHHGVRQLADADIWVATPASLIDSSVPWPQNAEHLRYLELAARRSDLVIIDEADRVQIQLDQMFAPAITLAGEETTSWLDEVAQHKISELVVGQRTQLSNRDVANWTTALNTASTITDRLYAMLVSSWELRKWVSGSYFNAWKLHGTLAEQLFPFPAGGEPDQDAVHRRNLLRVLEEYRKDPFGDQGKARGKARKLITFTNQLLHTSRSKSTSARVHDALLALAPASRTAYPQPGELTDKFELTLLLAALEPKLALMTGMWPRVQAALNLGFNQLHRRPLDYGPMVPESPMGNLLGFEFLVDGPDKGGIRSGELRFFRCSGVGRSLLTALPRLAEVDGRPGAHVLLMSGSSWAGKSSRYHVLAPVNFILKPEQKKIDQITRHSSIRLEFVWHEGRPLTLSGARQEDRPAILRTMALALTTHRENQRSRLELELADLSQHRRHLLVLTGSYDEAKVVADAMHSTKMKGRVLRLLADDERDPVIDESSAPVLRRGDVDRLRFTKARILVAPLLAVERGHNIMAACGEAAIGTVYFLARPNPRPDDLGLAIHAINDWITRALDDPDTGFGKWVSDAATIGAAGRDVRSRAYREWFRVLGRFLAWSRLSDRDRTTLTWDLLVLMWQVIGRLVRGGVEARVVLVDAAFAPKTAEALSKESMPWAHVVITDHDTPKSSLLLSIHEVLGECLSLLDDVPESRRLDRELTKALYDPFWQMIDRCLQQPTTGGKL
ncbi:hypothetical protein ACFFSW_34365 [Saccharothrix longispora]|uniref:pPIWI-RE three-gene island domain-containing protein n=1 Tax=Saccharothrix longispora TaxID=33920 RepID=A0ABU1PMI1_9PSEU|nr:hypothetical protein [Saccharothrix longispora]MDR6591761.1 hypothetical protein [Saccharothrix longispora]